MGVATGCGFKEIYRFPHTIYPYSSCICTFFSIPTFLFIFKNVFRSLYIERGMTHGEMGVWYIHVYRERHDTWGNGSLVYIEREA